MAQYAGPDGVPLDFPDTMSEDEVKAVMRRKFAPAPVATSPGKMASLGRGAAQGATLGFGDEIQGLIQAALPVAGDEGKSFFQRYNAERNAARQTNEAAQKAHGGYYLGGNIVGGMAPAVLTATLAPAGAASRIAQGAGIGATAGTGESRAENLGGLAKDAAIGAGVGGALAGTGELAAKYLPLAAQALGNKFLHNKAGQIAAKNPLSKEAIDVAYESGAIRPWRGIQGASDVLEAERNQVGAALQQHIAKLDAAGVQPPDKVALAHDLAAVGRTLREKSFDARSYQPYIDTAEELLTKPMLTISDSELLKRSLQGLADQAYKAPSWAPTKGTAKAYEGVASRFRGSIENAIESQKALAPDLAEQFVPLKQAYGPANEAYTAAAEGAARAKGRGILGLPEAVMLASHGAVPAAAVKAGRMFLPQTLGYLSWLAGKGGSTNPELQAGARSVLINAMKDRGGSLPLRFQSAVPEEEK
jgi:hypothetical protein